MLEAIYIITGQSGSGKTTAIGALEDIGIYCVDNIPVTLIPPLIESLNDSEHTGPLGIGLDLEPRTILKSSQTSSKRSKIKVYRLSLSSSRQPNLH